MIDVLLLNPRTENKASEVRKLKSAVYKDNVIHQTEEKLREPPNGLLILASLLEARNFSVEIVDASILKNPFQYIRDNADRFRMIGIGSLTNTFNKAVQLAKTAKRYNPNLYLVMGGPHASFDYENILRNYPFVDLVCIGEAESTFPWIVEKLLLKSTIDMIYSDRDFAVSSTYNYPGRVQNILQDVDILPKGIAYLSKSFVDPFIKQLDLADGDTSLSTTVKDDGKLIATGFPDPIDLSALPLPARHLLDRKYFTANILVNRGCSNECSFCSRTNLFPEMRLRPLDHVFDEIKQILSYKNYEFVNFYDNINVNRAYFREFLDRLIRMDFPLPWGAEMRADAIKVEDATLLKKAGCKLVATGVESADKKVLKRNFKYQDPKKVATGIKNLKKSGYSDSGILYDRIAWRDS